MANFGVIIVQGKDGQGELARFDVPDEKVLHSTLQYLKGSLKAKQEDRAQTTPGSPMPSTTVRYPQPETPQFGQSPQAAVPASMPQPVLLNGPGTAGTANARRDTLAMNRRFSKNPVRSF